MDRRGLALLVLTFADTFVTVLNDEEGGILVNRLVRWQWIAIRAFTRRVSRRWRPIVLRQVTGVLLLATILSWLAGVILGFAFIYLGFIGRGVPAVEGRRSRPTRRGKGSTADTGTWGHSARASSSLSTRGFARMRK